MNDDEAVNKMGNTMAAAGQENDGAKDKRNDMTTKEDNTTATG